MLAVAKITAKGQTTIPQLVRRALEVRADDLIAWEVGTDGTATVRRVLPLDLEYLRVVERTLGEWAVPPTMRPIVGFDAGFDARQHRARACRPVPLGGTA